MILKENTHIQTEAAVFDGSVGIGVNIVQTEVVGEINIEMIESGAYIYGKSIIHIFEIISSSGAGFKVGSFRAAIQQLSF